MRKYPFSPSVLDAMPEQVAEIYRGLEDTLLEEICSRLKLADNLNEVTVQDIRALRSLGIPLEEIQKAIEEASGVAMERLEELFAEVVERNQSYYDELATLAEITTPDVLMEQRDIDAIVKQTKTECSNVTQSMGFLLPRGGRISLVEPGAAYQWALDQAAVEVQSGAISYNQAITKAVKQLADSGLRRVDYSSGHRDHLDVAVRRATMTGIQQLNSQYSIQSMEYLGTDLVEVSAHAGARNTGTGPENHASWQGKVYQWVKDGKPRNPKYKDFIQATGYGTGEGLAGWNCRHSFHVFVEGVSERAYSDREVDGIDNPPFEYQGRTYTQYEATQKQRQIERTMRKLKRETVALESAGQLEEAKLVKARRRALSREYTAFSEAAGLPQQRERMKVVYSD